MNQILYTGGKKGKIGTNDTTKVVIVFVILIVVFAICLIGIGINLFTKVKNETGTDIGDLDKPGQSGSTNTIVDKPGGIEKPDKPEEPKEPEIKSKISIKFDSQLGGVQLKVTSRQKLKSISYWWDEEEPTIIESEENEYEVVITSKQGTHTLKIEVTDEKGYTKTVSQLVIGDAGPEVSISTDRISNYVITVKDDERVDKIVIVLNEETQEVEVNAKEFEYKVAIPEGDSVINVTAYNLNGLTTTKKAKIINFGR